MQKKYLNLEHPHKIRGLNTAKIKYGKSAPLYMELIWVDPNEINTIIYREEVKEVTGIHRS